MASSLTRFIGCSVLVLSRKLESRRYERLFRLNNKKQIAPISRICNPTSVRLNNKNARKTIKFNFSKIKKYEPFGTPNKKNGLF